MKQRTPAYWPTRIMLAVGLIVTAFVILAAGELMRQSELCLDGASPAVLCLDSNPVVLGVGVALAVFGLVWMLRIFRGHRDEPPAWRHRDR
jgi:hypothetical protein